MMKKRQLLYSMVLSFLFMNQIKSQEDYFLHQSRFMQKSNSSYFGMNSVNKVGVLYNSLSINETERIDNKYAFAAVSFDENKFSLGFDLNSLNVESIGLVKSIFNFTYIYKIQASNKSFFLPALSIGVGSSSMNLDNLIFEDQLDAAIGSISTETIDPLGELISNVNYFDLGVSLIYHNDLYILGLSIKHINQPNTSFNKESDYKKPLGISLLGGYEFDLNPYERNFLPRYSYLLAYGSVSKYDNILYMNLEQDVQFGQFSFGLNQQLSNDASFNINNIGLTVGLSYENFEFGAGYNFAIRTIDKIFSPSVFEIFVAFNFSKYRRNQRGVFKHLQTDNYY